MNRKQKIMLLLSLLFLITLVASEDDNKFRVPDEVTSNAEYYDYTGSRFAIFLEKVTYSEAKVLCTTRHGSLAELLDSRPAIFLAEALAESAVGFTSLWVGAQLHKVDDDTQVYRWNSGPEIFINDSSIYPEKEYPYWVDKPDTSTNTSMCLAMDRRGHDRPLLTDLPCSTNRPFICSLPISTGNNTGPTIVVPPIEGKDKTFYLFHAEVTWSGALSFCRGRGFRLASIEFEKDYDLLANRMLRTRPIMENAWTSGKFEDGTWKWLSNDVIIPTPDSAETTSVRPTNFPPWLRNEVIKDGCLLADRHICGALAFVEAKCERRRNIICETISVDKKKPVLTKIGNTSLWMSYVQETWRNAMKKCITCFEPSAKLITLPHDATETIKMIYDGMAISLKQDIRHIWIGAHLGRGNDIGDFFWVDSENYLNASLFKETDKLEPPFRPENNMAGGLVTLCKPSNISRFNTTSFKCLNMDREDQKNFFMYGLKCDVKQFFICEAKDQNVELKPECANPLGIRDEGTENRENTDPPETTTKKRKGRR